MKKKFFISVLAVLCCVLFCFGLASCKDKDVKYTADDIVYSDTAGEQVAYLRVIGDYWKTGGGAAMFGLMVGESAENPTVSVIAVGKTESAVGYYYDYNGYEYQTCKGSVEFEGETYYYNSGPFWFTNDVGNPLEKKSMLWIYSARFAKAEDMVKHMLTIGDRSKLAVPTISTYSDLRSLENSSKVVMLANDIDLGGALWEPINGFKGALDGAGYSIKNFTISGTSGHYGFFGEANNISVTNLTLEGIKLNVIGSNGDVGGLVGVTRNSTYKNNTIKGSISSILNNNVGGLAGYAENCVMEGNKNYAEVTGFEFVGGVVGQYSHKVTSEDTVLENNHNYGTVTGLSTDEDCDTGGVFGRLYFYPGAYKSGSSNWLRSVMNCNNYGAVTGAGHDIGGVVGAYTTSRWKSGDTYVDVAFANCVNEGTVTGADFHVGGIVGNCGSCRSVTNCENKGDVTANGYDVAGIVGSGSVSAVNTCKNSGNITGAAFVGGIMGWTSGIVSGCENSGNITATGMRNTCDYIREDNVAGVGGIVGAMNGYVEKSTNSGVITSTGGGSCIGGIAGGMAASKEDVIEGNVNNGEIIVTGNGNMVGGIVGKMFSWRPKLNDGEYTFSGKNTGNITAVNSTYVGGIIGYVDSHRDWSFADRTYIIIINSENSGTITGATRVAGILGTAYQFVRTDSIYWGTNKNTGMLFGTETTDLYFINN